MIIMNGKQQLLEIVLAFDLPSTFASLRDRRDQWQQQYTDEKDCSEQHS
ncbi:hypothetical protein [Blastopirellula marina]|nr:hypothetical protein [Blastopirellula marina]